MLNRVTRLSNIGLSENIRMRCLLHRNQLINGTASNMRIRRDAKEFGADTFFFYVLELLDVKAETRIRRDLERMELYWVNQLFTHDERNGYNSDAGGHRTRAANFRDRERKLMRSNSEKYVLMPHVDIYDAIDHDLLRSWVPGS